MAAGNARFGEPHVQVRSSIRLTLGAPAGKEVIPEWTKSTVYTFYLVGHGEIWTYIKTGYHGGV
jgi:hypothetical protein